MQLAFTTVDEFHGLLEQAGEALDYREVWPRLFPVANCPPELMRKFGLTAENIITACRKAMSRKGR